MSEEKEKKEEIAVPTRRTTLTKGFDSFFEDFRRAFDDFMSPVMSWTPRFPRLGKMPVKYPSVDITDNGTHYSFTAELPGFNKDDIEVCVCSNQLEIRAEMKSEKEEEDKNYLLHERSYSAFARRIDFPEEVVPEKVEGKMEDGILQLTVPKKEPTPKEKMRKITIK